MNLMTGILFESPNLAIRRFNTSDDAFTFELLNTPAWKKFIGDRGINTREDAVNYIINGPIASYNQYGYGGWIVMLKHTLQPIGMCGLFKRDYLDSPDLGFAFMPEFEGKGFAFESSMAAINYIKANYDITGLYATTSTNNHRSQRLLERCGFIANGTVMPTGEAEALILYHRSL
jgi:ribosomal-protein-alanine N-acetyltransferase